ncbi:MAG: Eco57I restriction-modification methylase domain-containing protein [Kiritimatiellales bacterium]|nr:Eco57I restriction-modification methylase domain-containing protein [Kiritimatiellales bacterium]MCF7863341.1 Eco57I restriction-modification methylase domain-containing protein [Kiritimatiellales bacterium]
MSAPESVRQLIETFGNNLAFYKSAQYNEAQLRQEFLDPFFKELGWDMDNAAGLAPQYRDVIHEASIKIGGATKAPDYAFSIHGQYKFFLEAKKPSVNIQDNTEPAYQLRRYGWSAKLPISILTDFEEFAIYDCRKRPKRGEKASSSRLNYFKYTDYIEKWDELCATFSKDAILKGSFDKYTVDSKRHRGTETVDSAFLAEIENWRNLLARNFALRNPALSVRDLNFAVQKTIDRLIFLRICEDRGTEDYKRLATLLNGGRIYPRLLDLFMQADARYNSGLFHFSAEKNRGAADTITPHIDLDDKVLKEILAKLYYPESPYEFSVLPADILGQVYEQFLGKTIQLTAGHQAKIEEKPEVRKAGGVYYTPSYIVDYIVNNTLGRLLDGDDPAKPNPIAVSKAAEIKVLDPACGSGSFLIVAYQHLLDWHLRQYTADPETAEPDPGKIKYNSAKIYQAPGGAWKLTTDERKRILLNNIHGVDIDAQAVEVTKLSLLLKVIEGETQQVLQRDWIRERQRILPDLESNIKCGNSLIGPDFYDNEQMLLLDEETQYRINVFDWKTAFPEIMNRGGFDCVIGNPPYVRIQGLMEWAPQEANWYKTKFASAAQGNFDIYVCFVEKALELMGSEGKTGLILPHKFFNAQYGAGLRGLIAKGQHLSRVVHFGDQQVFSGATTYTCLMLLEKSGADECYYVKVHDLDGWIKQQERSACETLTARNNMQLNEAVPVYRIHNQTTDAIATSGTIPARLIGSAEWNFVVGNDARLQERLHRIKTELGDVANIFVGLQTSADKIFVLPVDTDIESGLVRPFLQTGDLSGYMPPQASACMLFPYDLSTGKAELIPAAIMEKQYPKGWAHLCSHRETLMNRERGKWRHENWYAFGRSQNLTLMDEPKLIIQVTARKPTVLLDTEGLHMTGGGSGPFYGIRPKDPNLSLEFLLGLLNSTLFGMIVKAQSTNLRGGYIKFSKQYIESAPIPPIDFDNAGDVAKHDRMVGLVERMLELNSKKATENNPETLRLLETQIAATDRQIGRLVYDLYNLTPEEIAIVEGRS